jgi:hypothetical protein
MFDARRAGDLTALVGLRLRNECFRVVIANGAIKVDSGDADKADATLKGEARAIAAAIYGGAPLETLESAGELEVSGAREIAARFVTLFPLPSKAPAPRPRQGASAP